MKLLTELALRRSSVTVLIIILLLVGGVFTYRSLQVELFPEIEFPLVTISTFYPSANPEAVARDVTAPIEAAISGVNGIDSIQSVSSENRSVVLAEFEFGVDMEEAESTISGNVGRVFFPDGVKEPIVGRIDPEAFPVLQVSLLGDREMTELQRLMDSLVLPAVVGIDGVFNVEVTGRTEPRVVVTLDAERLAEHGISRAQVSRALSESNVALPAGAVSAGGQIVPVRASSGYGSVEEMRNLVVGTLRAARRPGRFAGTPLGRSRCHRDRRHSHEHIEDEREAQPGVEHSQGARRQYGRRHIGRDRGAGRRVGPPAGRGDSPDQQRRAGDTEAGGHAAARGYPRLHIRGGGRVRVPHFAASHPGARDAAELEADDSHRAVDPAQHLHRYRADGPERHEPELHDPRGPGDLRRTRGRRQHRGAGERVPPYSEGARTGSGSSWRPRWRSARRSSRPP